MKKEKNKGKVIFRRINGRVIPIKTDKYSDREKRGAIVAGTGVAVGLGGGVAASAAVEQSYSMQRLARLKKSKGKHQFKVSKYNQMLLSDQGGVGDKRRLKQAWEGAKSVLQGRILGRRAAKIKKYGTRFGIAASLASGALLVGGLDPFIDRRTPGKEGTGKDVGKAFIEHASATGLAAAITLVGGRKMGSRKIARIFRKKYGNKHWK